MGLLLFLAPVLAWSPLRALAALVVANSGIIGRAEDALEGVALEHLSVRQVVIEAPGVL